MSSNLAQYGQYDTEEALKEEQHWQNAGKYLKLEAGNNVIRFLPPTPGKKTPFRVVWTHYITPPGGRLVVFACPSHETNKPCPVCVSANKLRESPNPADQDRARDLFAHRRVLANVVNRAEEEAGVQILSFGKQIHEALIELRKNIDWGGDFTHPENGFDITIKRTGASFKDTKYTVTPKRPSPLGNMEWITQQIDLEQQVYILTPEEIMAKVRGEETTNSGASPAAKGRTIVDAAINESRDETDPF